MRHMEMEVNQNGKTAGTDAANNENKGLVVTGGVEDSMDVTTRRPQMLESARR